MSLAAKLLSASGVSAAVDTLYVDDAFSSFVYTGNGSTQTITNGIDLAGKGGLVWIKGRGGSTHQLFDTGRGDNFVFDTSSTGQGSPGWADYFDFNADGFGIPTTWSTTNLANGSFVSWTFAKAAKFFDIVTYTGTGANRTISHNLGIAPGMIMVKRTDTTGSWMVYHNSIANTENLVLNTTAAKVTNATAWNSTTATASVFSLGTHAGVNANAGTYVAYLFAHDTSADGIVQCGSFTGYTNISLGWEPQLVLVKTTNTTGNWIVFDTARGLQGGASSTTPMKYLLANTSGAEVSDVGAIGITATGFQSMPGSVIGGADTLIYLAIRRPNKPPTLGTQVYNAIARTGTGAAATVTGVGFAPDLVSWKRRNNAVGGEFMDRLRGVVRLGLSGADAEGAMNFINDLISYDMDGVSLGPSGSTWINTSGGTEILHFFKRAPGVFDQICFSGTGANKTESHGLASAPELWLVKGRSGATQWVWGSSLLANTEKIVMPSPAGKVTDATAWNSTYPTSSVISLGTAAAVNTSAATYTAYLWATKTGISKVFGYTGDGASGKVINCGFTTGARFVMIVRADTTGSVFIWDTVRGIVAGNDPHLCLNTTAAEVTTDDSIDPNVVGFCINQVAATNINVNGATYIGLAFA